MLPGVGHGFFDDQQRTILFNLGRRGPAAHLRGRHRRRLRCDGPGDLVRFNLDNPSGGAPVVYSGRQVLAAQALPNGQVVGPSPAVPSVSSPRKAAV